MYYFRDELVIDNPTLFAAEDQSDDDEGFDNQRRSPANHIASTGQQQQHQKASASRFAIADEDSDDGFDDFADWDEEETLTSVVKKDGKDH